MHILHILYINHIVIIIKGQSKQIVQEIYLPAVNTIYNLK